MEHKAFFVAALAPFILLAGCGGDGTSPPPPSATASPTPTPPPAQSVTVDVDFGVTGEDWTRDIADFRNRADVNFVSRVEDLPPNLTNERGLLLAGSNFTDDLAMYAWLKVEGLAPNQDYRIGVTLTIAASYPPGCIGVGGAPGEGVSIKAGAADVEPRANPSLNVDKGDQETGGSEAVVIGDLAIPGAGGCTDNIFGAETIGTTDDTAPVVRANASGELWLIALSDSGFESRSEWYLLEGSWQLDPV